ncbi:MAG: hypothetical protein E6Q70_05945 [Pseudomonas monteilii]|nr:MAG: hypothetical protein E6Q70_05945 [Pseudomonas monteilii]
MSRRRTAANTGEAGAIHRIGFFAGTPAPTGDASARGLSANRQPSSPMSQAPPRPTPSNVPPTTR